MQKCNVTKMQHPGDTGLGMKSRPFRAECGIPAMWQKCHSGASRGERQNLLTGGPA